MRMYRHLSLLLLAFLSAGMTVTAQTTPPGVWGPPWNHYQWERIPNNFTSIIGSGGTLVPGSNTATDAPNFVLPLAIPQFYFLAQRFTAGFTMIVGPTGYISFNGSTTPGPQPAPYLMYGTTEFPYSSKVVMAFWGNVQPAGVPDGGVYWKTDTGEGQAIMIIEWRVRSRDFPTKPPGNIQMKLFELGKIEIHYGPIPITLRMPTTGATGTGAMVGIKNYGQRPGNPSDPAVGDPTDAEKFLLMLNPRTAPDTAAMTRLRTLDIPGAPYTPEYRADMSSYVLPTLLYRPSPYFHYTFPDSAGQRTGYRIKPMDYEMGAETTYVTRNGLPELAAFTPNDLPKIAVRLRNYGTVGVNDIPIEASLYRNGKEIDVKQDVVKYIGPQDSILFTFPSGISPNVANTTGLYRVRVRLKTPTDPAPGNDSVETTFTIRPSHDIATLSASYPYLAPQNYPIARAPVGLAVGAELRTVNVGTEVATDIVVGYAITDENGATIATASTPLGQALKPMEEVSTILNSWKPEKPGRYYLRTFSRPTKDEVEENNEFPAAASPGIPLDVVHLHDLGIGPFPLYSREPQGSSYAPGDSIAVEAVVVHRGFLPEQSVKVTAEISDADGVLEYIESITLPAVAGDTRVAFREFVPKTSGRYCVTIRANLDNDPTPKDNEATWCCMVTGTSAAVYVDPGTAGTLAIRPNPARTHVTIAYHFPETAPVRITITDAIGRRVRTIDGSWRRADNEVEIMVDDLPVGSYILRVETSSGTTEIEQLNILR